MWRRFGFYLGSSLVLIGCCLASSWVLLGSYVGFYLVCIQVLFAYLGGYDLVLFGFYLGFVL